MGDSQTAVAPSVGLAVLHLFIRVDESTDLEGISSAIKSAIQEGDQVVCVATLGHKADACLMLLAEDLWRLQRFQAAMRRARAEVCWSYLSVTELSEYGANLPEEMKEARLHPLLPPEGKAAFCFYPMSKRRLPEYNWYALPFDERLKLMGGHGAVGRKFRGKILQLITGSTGLDDWEWGVTLFATYPDDLKQCVYEMRFDEASALYADFGPFVTGIVCEPDELIARLSQG